MVAGARPTWPARTSGTTSSPWTTWPAWTSGFATDDYHVHDHDDAHYDDDTDHDHHADHDNNDSDHDHDFDDDHNDANYDNNLQPPRELHRRKLLGDHEAIETTQKEEDKGYVKWKDFCSNKGGHIAVVHNAQENNFLKEVASDRKINMPVDEFGDVSIWIGLPLPVNGKWDDGSNVNYTNWGAGEPGQGRCTRFLKQAGTWASADCESPNIKHGFCQVDPGC
ncbi:C-type lectin-2 [Aphelenchoides avenae]|nr:C-type lectin-2 [Aphelenchus avenae]